MLTKVTRQLVTHPKSLEKAIQEVVDRLSDLEAEVKPVKGAGKLRDKQHADREARAEGKRKFQEARAAEKAEEERIQAKAEAEEDALAAAEQGRLDSIKRSKDRAAARAEGEKEGSK